MRHKGPFLRLFAWAWLVAMPMTTHAQIVDVKGVDMSFEARGAYQNQSVDGKKNEQESGFKGHMINLFLQGEIGKGFSYKVRQRLNKINKDYAFFDTFDWLYMQWDMTPHLGVMFGKWVVLTGGWEYDPAPIDVFQIGEASANLPCYQWGVDAFYSFNNKRDKLIGQIIQSPFRDTWKACCGEDKDLYGYSLMWYGNHGIYHTAWSANIIEYNPGKYITYLYLGNRIKPSDKWEIDFDVMNRAASGQTVFLKDMSLNGVVKWQPSPKIKAHAKINYDVNRTGENKDYCLYDGTEITCVGGGVEIFPLGNDKIRFHATYSYSFGKNTNPCAYLHDKESRLEVGATWKMQVL